MKKILTVLSIVLTLTLAFQSATAQLSKQEQKEYKKRIKSLTAEQYKALLEENKSMRSQLTSLKKETAGVDDKLKEKDDQIADYQDQISSMRSELAAAKRKAASSEDEGAMSRSVVPAKGVVFKVQIGAFKQKDLKKFAQDNPSFEVDDENGTLRYTVGMFRDYWEADTFKKYLREMGVKGAWIVAYKDGQRVDIKDVLEGVI